MTDQEAHDTLWRLAQAHVEGVNPPDTETAAAGTWQGEAPDAGAPDIPDLPEGSALTDRPRPTTVSAQAAKTATVAVAQPTAPQPKVDIRQSLGYRPPSADRLVQRDDELASLQTDAKQRRSDTSVGQAVSDFTERPSNFLDYAQRLGGGGVSSSPAKSSMWKDYAAEGDRAISDLEMKRKSDAGMAASAEASDPRSQTADTYRSVLLKFAPDLADKLAAATPKQMLAIAPWLESYAKDAAERAKAKVGAAAKENPEELATYKAAMSKRYPKAADLINSLSTMKGAQDLQNSLDAEAGRATTIQAARIAADATRGEARNVREDTKAMKATEEAAKQALPGYVHDPSVQVGPTEIANLRTGHAESQVMSKLIDELDGLVAKNGITVWPSADKTRMQADLKQLQLKAKGKAFAELGVLSGPDLAILEDLTGDPTNVMSVFKGGADGVRERLQVFKQTLDSGMEEARHAHGYSASAATATGGTVKMKFPNGSSDDVPAAEVEEAKSHGGVPL